MSRKYAIVAVLALLVVLAGCTNRVGVEEGAERKVVRSDNGVRVVNLEVTSEGKRECYHTLEANVTNTNDYTIKDVEITISVIDENGQILSEFNTGYIKIQPNQTKELKVQHGPQKNQCWDYMDAKDYHVEVNFAQANQSS